MMNGNLITTPFAGRSRKNRDGIDEGTFLRSFGPYGWAYKSKTEIMLLDDAVVGAGNRGSFGSSVSVPTSLVRTVACLDRTLFRAENESFGLVGGGVWSYVGSEPPEASVSGGSERLGVEGERLVCG
jgi:hypothetical protein